jgi:hypothetical protein
VIRFIINDSMAHFIFGNNSNLELLKFANTRFVSYYFTFRHLLKVIEALDSMASSDSWHDLTYMATSTSDRNNF